MWYWKMNMHSDREAIDRLTIRFFVLGGFGVFWIISIPGLLCISYM